MNHAADAFCRYRINNFIFHFDQNEFAVSAIFCIGFQNRMGGLPEPAKESRMRAFFLTDID